MLAVGDRPPLGHFDTLVKLPCARGTKLYLRLLLRESARGPHFRARSGLCSTRDQSPRLPHRCSPICLCEAPSLPLPAIVTPGRDHGSSIYAVVHSADEHCLGESAECRRAQRERRSDSGRAARGECSCGAEWCFRKEQDCTWTPTG